MPRKKPSYQFFRFYNQKAEVMLEFGRKHIPKATRFEVVEASCSVNPLLSPDTEVRELRAYGITKEDVTQEILDAYKEIAAPGQPTGEVVRRGPKDLSFTL